MHTPIIDYVFFYFKIKNVFLIFFYFSTFFIHKKTLTNNSSWNSGTTCIWSSKKRVWVSL